MDVHLTAEQEAFVREAVEAGRVDSAEDAVRQAMLLWEERERRRLEILSAVDRSEASLARGEERKITSRKDASQLADDVKRRSLTRMKGEQGVR